MLNIRFMGFVANIGLYTRSSRMNNVNARIKRIPSLLTIEGNFDGHSDSVFLVLRDVEDVVYEKSKIVMQVYWKFLRYEERS